MARTALTITDSDIGGTDVVYSGADATNGNVFVNTGSDYLLVENTGVGSTDVTVISVPCSHGRVQHETKTVAAGATTVLGPFPPSLFNQLGTSNVHVDFTVGTGVNVAVIRR
jgi:hypothetical protein